MTTVIQRSFSGGEFAPSLYARVDFSKYAVGARSIRNNIVLKHGGVANRAGTTFVGEAADSAKKVRLIPFIFNVQQTYVLEFGHETMRVIKDGTYLSDDDATIDDISNASPAVVTTAAAHGFSTGDEVYISGVEGMPEVNGRSFKITDLSSTTFSLQDMDGTTDIDSNTYGTYSSGGTADRIYQIDTDYKETELFDLQYVQSADIVTIVHPSHPPAELARTGDTAWTLTDITFEPSIGKPTISGVTAGGSGDDFTYKVTAVKEETYEESLPSNAFTINNKGDPSVSNEHTVSWGAVTGAVEYNVYRQVNGVDAFVGTAGTNSYKVNSTETDVAKTPPIDRSVFGSTDNYPATVTYYQQRLAFANTNNEPEKIFLSRSGDFKNFTIRNPLQDDDAITLTIAGRQVNEVRHMFDLNALLVLTIGGEWTIQGASSEVITPTDINTRQYSYNGSSSLSPIVANGNALYVQARGSIVRDLGFDFEVDGYRGNDLTIISNHLFDGHTLVDWAYQKTPQSIVWAVRDDGVLLGLTYVQEQQLVAWHRHDFDGGKVESVAVVPESDEDILYLVIKRTINNREVRYVERMNTRFVDPEKEEYLIFTDSTLVYDGVHTGSTTMTLSGGTTWAYTESLTLTASSATFSSSDIGNQVHINYSENGEDETLRLTINAFTSSTVVTVKANRTVPSALRNTAQPSWAKAVDEIRGLWHLEGKDVSIYADRNVVASPNNDSYETVTVSGGMITLDKPYSVINIGLPYISDLETLDIDTPQGQTLADKAKLITTLTAYLEKTRGIFVGPKPPSDDEADPIENLVELKLRSDEDYDNPVSLKTGPVTINIEPEWNKNGRIFIRQIDPLPSSILAVAPGGYLPFVGG